jgi:hypothetical protein
LLAGVAVLLLAAYLLIGRPVPIESYRVLDERTIAIRVVTGDLTWTRVAAVRETDSAVEVAITAVSAPLPMADIGRPVELTVDLQRPIGDRTVFDANANRGVPIGE